MTIEVTGERKRTYHPKEKILEIFIPIRLIRRGGRTHIQTPDGEPLALEPIEDTALMRALAQAHLWLQKLEDGEFKNVKALATHYQQNESYVSRILRLTMLSPILQEKILEGESIGGRTLADFMDGVQALWKDQLKLLQWE
ncbi:hypothetical protein M3P05_12560 [Sansalvadorimonas sp. 2012CJ34-2]|uniref:Uncharacterized protein n=1 Tax=Parendozoicomonas callyspongiae TaxID=2942213 RepID=A0ABT0PHM3_9GAMM|nr:hypothetical protein [Sansalvadorimonas sp. 2012CJ34-2]MCL6270756.1 hypothetical protein [Sansalvadorimonas sp. 2012CJ34-2]